MYRSGFWMEGNSILWIFFGVGDVESNLEYVVDRL